MIRNWFRRRRHCNAERAEQKAWDAVHGRAR